MTINYVANIGKEFMIIHWQEKLLLDIRVSCLDVRHLHATWMCMGWRASDSHPRNAKLVEGTKVRKAYPGTIWNHMEPCGTNAADDLLQAGGNPNLVLDALKDCGCLKPPEVQQLTASPGLST